MSDETGTLRVDVEIGNPARPGEQRVVGSVLVDTGAEFSWFPQDLLQSLGIERVKVWYFPAGGRHVLSRWTGGVGVYLGGIQTLDEVVFGEPGNLVFAGAPLSRGPESPR